MDVRPAGESGSIVVALREPDGRLLSLGEGPLSSRFCAWQGASGRRYVASVYPVDRSADFCGLPSYDAFVLIAVGSGLAGRSVLAATPIERPSELRGALAAGLAAGATEWHVHLLAEDRRARAAMTADLRARHCKALAACA